MAGISKSETLNRLSEKTGLTKKQVGQFLDELAALAYRKPAAASPSQASASS